MARLRLRQGLGQSHDIGLDALALPLVDTPDAKVCRTQCQSGKENMVAVVGEAAAPQAVRPKPVATSFRTSGAITRLSTPAIMIGFKKSCPKCNSNRTHVAGTIWPKCRILRAGNLVKLESDAISIP